MDHVPAQPNDTHLILSVVMVLENEHVLGPVGVWGDSMDDSSSVGCDSSSTSFSPLDAIFCQVEDVATVIVVVEGDFHRRIVIQVPGHMV